MVPVGKTPVSKYATWDDHRDAMHQEFETRRTAMGAAPARDCHEPTFIDN